MNEHTSDPADRLRRSAGSADSAPELAPELVTSASSRRAPRLINHGRVTRAASVSMAAVAAVAVGSLVIANPFAPRAPLFLAAEGSGPASAQSSALAEDARIALWINYEYLAGDGLSTDSGRGNVYQLQRVGTPEQVLRDAAAEFGLAGEPVESAYFDPAYPTYVIGAEDGTAPSLTVTWAGTGSWWYSNPAAYPPPVCERVSGQDENGESFEYDDCVQAQIENSLAPSGAEAQAQAAELFGATGLDVDADEIRIIADEWQTMAAASLTVEGVATAIEYAMAWAPTGEIAWATGHAIDIIDRGGFDTVSAVSAVERLTDWRWFGAAGPDYQGGMNILAAESGVARDAGAPLGSPDTSVSSPVEEPGTGEPGEPEPTEPGTSEPGEPGTEPVEPIDPGTGEEPKPVDPGTEPEPLPTIEPEPMPEPETVTVTVDDAEATLLLMRDSQGNAWLVPGFAMPHPDGWFNTIVSLIEGVIELPAPFDGEITPYVEETVIED